jgi:hypothetical protein
VVPSVEAVNVAAAIARADKVFRVVVMVVSCSRIGAGIALR